MNNKHIDNPRLFFGILAVLLTFILLNAIYIYFKYPLLPGDESRKREYQAMQTGTCHLYLLRDSINAGTKAMLDIENSPCFSKNIDKQWDMQMYGLRLSEYLQFINKRIEKSKIESDTKHIYFEYNGHSFPLSNPDLPNSMDSIQALKEANSRDSAVAMSIMDGVHRILKGFENTLPHNYDKYFEDSFESHYTGKEAKYWKAGKGDAFIIKDDVLIGEPGKGKVEWRKLVPRKL